MKKMNDDENNAGPQEWIDPALEARVVAGVLGETSAFEASELERILVGNPELTIFKRRIEAVHALAGAAVRPEMPRVQLSPERRQKLLATIGAQPMAMAKKTTVRIFPLPAWLSSHVLQRVAACLVIGAVLAIFATTSGYVQKKDSRRDSLLTGIGDLNSFSADETNQLRVLDEKPSPERTLQTRAAEAAATPMSLAMTGAFEKMKRDKKENAPRSAAAKPVLIPQAAPMVLQQATSDREEWGEAINKELSEAIAKQTGEVSSMVDSLEHAQADAVSFQSQATSFEPRKDFQDGGQSTQANALAQAEKKMDQLESSQSASGGSASAVLRGNHGGFAVSAAIGAPRPPATPDASKPKEGFDYDMANEARAADQAPADDITSTRAAKMVGGKLAESDGLNVEEAPPRVRHVDQAWARPVRKFQTEKALADNSDASPVPDEVPVEERRLRSDAGKDRALTFQNEIKTAKQPFSTFSLHVSDVSFQLAKDALAKGSMPDPERIRAEEFYNAFDYNDPSPAPGEEVACRIEQCANPFVQQRDLVRIALKVAAAGRAAGQPLRLTILLDTSGSMEREDRAASVGRALRTLASLLGPNDRISLIGFARTPRLLAEQVPGDQADKLVELAARTPSEGGTNLEQALALASELALKQFLPAAQNRIVLLTDGAANLGNADPARLARQIEKTRQQGVSFDACGVGANGLNDEMLEALTRKGDGRYYFLNRAEDADAGFARQLAGALRPAAENVKVQVVFNPARVSQYRLIGFEKHLLKKEDFRNDKVQAAELSAEEAGVAVYQVETLPEGEGELGEVFVRFRDPANGMMVERSWTMSYDAKAPAFDQASPSMQLAATAALLAERLRGDARVDLDAMAPVITNLRGQFSHQAKVNELIRMFEQMRR